MEFSAFYGEVSDSWRHPDGWQAVIRRTQNESLAVIHTFAGEFPERIEVPAEANKICRIMCSEENRVSLDNGKLTVEWIRN